MEASAITAPAGISRLPLATPLLRLRSDEQLLSAFRAGNETAFDVLHERYRQRLFAYVRQMLSVGSRQDAEDVLQDVFVRAYGALRADGREMNVRAWLYRVAHNRCIDHLRRPVPPAAEIYEVSRKPLHDPMEEAQRREDLARLVEDISRLPEQQRSALLMREIDGLSYHDLAEALDVSVPAIKSLLVRARVGLVDAAQARDADCHEIRAELLDAYDRGVKASGHARRHMRSCDACADYRHALRNVRRSFAALTPAGLGPLAFGAKLLGLSGAGGGAAAGGTAATGALAGGGAIAGVTACKVAAVVCTAALVGGGAEAKHMVRDRHPAPHARTAAAAHPAAAAPATGVSPPVFPVTADAPAPAVSAAAPAVAPRPVARPVTTTKPATPAVDDGPTDPVLPPSDEAVDPVATPSPAPTPAAKDDTSTTGTGTTTDGATTPSSTSTTSTGTSTSSSSAPSGTTGSTATTASAASAPPAQGSSSSSGQMSGSSTTQPPSGTAR
ncbi:MAG TPA: RNA polymerase sigma factor [Solirubrobacteraceae bacterium]|nr:RNA polymerase sigma factor [Solirubrobacteraceae bacterium]